ncbi:nucleoporin p58/p45 isoform X2 [Lingula anatina]|nr:nucleoporin p58/p45 isoform X2 [Lingula anatina]|eukprot:XP_013378989.1 nucleoporin p58/p45 isoform X2 [Lingula anatina]
MPGFSFGATPNTQAGSTGFQLGQTQATPVGTSGGLSFGAGLGVAKTTASGGFSFGTPAASTATATATAAVVPPGGSTGFTLPLNLAKTTPTLTLGGTTTTTTTAGGLSLGTAAATPSFGQSLSFGQTSTTKPSLSTGFSFGQTAAAKSGLSLGGASLGFNLTGTTTTSTTTSTSTGLFGATTSTTGASLFGATTTTTASKGLGGVDPKTSTAGGNVGANGKGGDNKAFKETNLPNDVVQSVETFKKYVKDEKSVREEIARMSSKPLFKVQEDVQTLRQLLAVVANGLQRNAVTIEKLKMESAQELKKAEMAQRTKEIPPGLQYENTAPSECFHHLVEEFEGRMLIYRQQIEEMENALTALSQPNIFTPQELSVCLRRLHETFVALAAQLQGVHESVKAQKEQYLNYRRIFQGDSADIFEKRKKASEKMGISQRSMVSVGPTPFTGMSNVAAVAMATALNRGQQPSGAPPTVGLSSTLGTTQTGTLGTGLGFGTTVNPTTQSSGFGGGTTGTFGGTASTFGGTASTFGGFGSNTTGAAAKPLG